MQVEQLVDVVKQLQDRAAEQEALRATMLEIGTALSDIVQLLEKSGPETAKAIATALKNVRIGDINVPAPTVHMAPAVAWEFTHEAGRDGVITRSVARPITTEKA